MNIHDQDTFRRGLNEGSHQKAVETAKAMVLKNIPIDIIADCTGLSQETILKLAN